MRSLVAAAALLGALGAGLRPGIARADDEVVLRGNYWRDRNTRVLAPEIEFTKELPTGTIVGGGYLLDAITSASAAGPGGTDQPFTELRNQIGARVAQRIGPVTLGANYRYSTESDYWAHVGGGSVALDLFQKNTTLAASYVYSHAEVGRRVGPKGFVPVGHLAGHYLIGTFSQVLSRFALLDLTLELNRVGDHNDVESIQSNPYRVGSIGGNMAAEIEPYERNRIAASGGLRLAAPIPRGVLRHLVFYAKLRYTDDDWHVQSIAPELRMYFGVGPVGLRFTGRYYFQTEADFWARDAQGKPVIMAPVYDKGVTRAYCPPAGCFTFDAKLSRFSSVFFEIRLQVPLRFLDFKGMPLGRFLGEGQLAVSYGHYVNDRFAHMQYGDAEVGGLEMIFPL